MRLAEEKTKILEFGKFARQNRRAGEERKPDIFDFIGFTFYCGMDGKKQFFRCRVRLAGRNYVAKARQ